MPRATDSMVLGPVGQQAIDDTVPEVLPDIPCKCVILKNPASNTGNIAFRNASDGTTLTLANGYVLAPGEESPVLWVGNTDQIILLGSVDEDPIQYLPYQ